MMSLKEKYKKPVPFMKWLRKIRNKISKETHGMTAKELNEYYDKRAEKSNNKNEKLEKQDIYFTTMITDYVICRVLVMFKNKFDSFQWVWDHQEEVYKATKDKNWSELVDYFESIYKYIQEN